jgi:hypothetical protein
MRQQELVARHILSNRLVGHLAHQAPQVAHHSQGIGPPLYGPPQLQSLHYGNQEYKIIYLKQAIKTLVYKLSIS